GVDAAARRRLARAARENHRCGAQKAVRPLLAIWLILVATLAGAAEKPASAPSFGTTVKGTVPEGKDGGSYTYLLLKARDGIIWAAVGNAPVKVGTEVTVENAMVMKDFHSKALNRNFDLILLGNLAAPGPRAAGAGAGSPAHLAGAKEIPDVRV